jgi:hypothetical protein
MNRLSWRNDRAALFRSGHPGLAVQVEVIWRRRRRVQMPLKRVDVREIVHGGSSETEEGS